MEIAGHTDSQGREEMNLALSRSRADAVLAALMARRVLTSSLTAKGYGEAEPIADNATEEGREANRRIEFRLRTPEPQDVASAEDDAAAEPASEASAGDETPAEITDAKGVGATTDEATEAAPTGDDANGDAPFEEEAVPLAAPDQAPPPRPEEEAG